ncbi:DNA-processing protein DprA [Thalassotalea ganghwensis]
MSIDNISRQQYDKLSCWLALSLIPKLSIKRKLALFHSFGIEALYYSTPSLQSLGLTVSQYQHLKQPQWNKIESIIRSMEQANASIVTFDDASYPRQLKQIYDPPLVLFVKGDIKNLSRTQIAIVGSRNATIQGKEVAKKFACELSQQEIVITSGLASGIDSAAHQGAVDVNSATIAVVATGIDIVYPARHRALQTRILEAGGTIVSEFFPGSAPRKSHFPRRNRLISGLSLGVVVVEAALKSGSLITARTALEQNREVFAVPGSIYNENVRGCHWLIKQGAKLIENIADIKEEIKFKQENSLNYCSSKDKNLTSKKSCDQDLFNDPLLASVGDEITPVDLVVSRSKLPIDVVLTRLTMLELRGLVSAVPGGYLKLYRG